MNLEARKIEFVQEFLKLQSDEAVSQLEKLLKKQKKELVEQVLEPMTHEELNRRIDQSESDFKNNRFKTSSELLAKYSNDKTNHLVAICRKTTR